MLCQFFGQLLKNINRNFRVINIKIILINKLIHNKIKYKKRYRTTLYLKNKFKTQWIVL